MVSIGIKLTIDPDLVMKLGSEQKLWIAAHDDGSKNRINEDAVFEAASSDITLGILTGLFMWIRKRFRNIGKTKDDLAAEKEAAKINRTCGALDVMLLEYIQSAHKGMVDEETLDDLIKTLEEMQGYEQAGKLSIPGRKDLTEIRNSIARYTVSIANSKAVQSVQITGNGDFNIIRNQLIQQKELICNDLRRQRN